MKTFGKTIYDEETKLWCARKANIVFNPKVNIAKPILWTFSNNPEKIVQVNEKNLGKLDQQYNVLFVYEIFR